MSQGFQKGGGNNNFSFSNEYKLMRVLQQQQQQDGFFDAAVDASAAGQEEEEEGTSSNMQLSEMFCNINYPTDPVFGDITAGGRGEAGLLFNSTNWSSVLLGEGSGSVSVSAGVGIQQQRSSEQGDRFFFLNTSSSNEVLHQDPQSSGYQFPAPRAFSQMSYGPVATLSIFGNSSYARAAQELLEEFCSVARRGQFGGGNSSLIPSHVVRGGAAASSSSSKEIARLSSADRFESQRKKSKLLSMLEEVERRYNHYSEQMQMVVNSFESVMGFGAAAPYTGLAQKAMSRHFRCLKDGIAGQLKQTCELLGDKEGAIVSGSGGLTKVETPKLRLIDQSLRQQRAFHQLGAMDHDQAWRPQRGLPDRSVTMLRAWLFDHFLHPYPSDADKHLLARQTGLSRNQVSNWFINARVRLWKPMVEDMYQKEAKEVEDSQQQNINDQDETNSHNIILAASNTSQQMSPLAHINPTLLLHIPDSSSPRQTLQALVGPMFNHPQPRPEDEDAAASSLVYSPRPPYNDIMYRQPAAMSGPSAAARTGDLSLTLGLRHAGVNPPETGRFGL